MRYASVIEKAEGNYSAYVPDLPGCVAMACQCRRRQARWSTSKSLHDRR
jgi:hypothetical protein